MWFRRVTLLVAFYLALDLANPMMPGAFQLVEGSLETIAGCQARGAEVPVLAIAMTPCGFSCDLPQRDPAPHVRWREISASPPVPILFRAPLALPGTAPSSPDDD